MPVVLWINPNQRQSQASADIAKDFDKEDELSDTVATEVCTSMSSITTAGSRVSLRFSEDEDDSRPQTPASPVDEIFNEDTKVSESFSSCVVSDFPLLHNHEKSSRTAESDDQNNREEEKETALTLSQSSSALVVRKEEEESALVVSRRELTVSGEEDSALVLSQPISELVVRKEEEESALVMLNRELTVSGEEDSALTTYQPSDALVVQEEEESAVVMPSRDLDVPEDEASRASPSREPVAQKQEETALCLGVCSALSPVQEEELALVVSSPRRPQSALKIYDEKEGDSSHEAYKLQTVPLHLQNKPDVTASAVEQELNLVRTQSLPLCPETEVGNAPRSLSRAQSLKERRREMEAWNTTQKSRAQLILSPETRKNTVTSKKLLTPTSPKPKKTAKREVARNLRMIERLAEAENLLQSKADKLASESANYTGKRRIRAIQQKAETKLRISQIDKARDFYQHRMVINSAGHHTVLPSAGPVPMEILKIVSNLPRKLTLSEELEAYIKELKDEDREKVANMFKEIEYWEDDEEMALDVGEMAPDFCFSSNHGKKVDSKVLRKRNRLIVVFYHRSESPMCIMNLTALEVLSKTFEREGAALVGIGFEADTKETASKSGASFPLLADEAGITATKFGIIRSETRPILSTFIIDTTGEILWRYVNVDYTKRPEPLDILEALPAQTKKKRKFFGRSN